MADSQSNPEKKLEEPAQPTEETTEASADDANRMRHLLLIARTAGVKGGRRKPH